jgi:hypothetical protein
MSEIKKNDISERFARTFEAGRLLGAIQTYEAMLEQLLKLPPKSFMKVSDLKATCSEALSRLRAERSARAQERLEVENAELEARDQENPSVP